jgi:hypothetical protein
MAFGFGEMNEGFILATEETIDLIGEETTALLHTYIDANHYAYDRFAASIAGQNAMRVEDQRGSAVTILYTRDRITPSNGLIKSIAMFPELPTLKAVVARTPIPSLKEVPRRRLFIDSKAANSSIESSLSVLTATSTYQRWNELGGLLLNGSNTVIVGDVMPVNNIGAAFDLLGTLMFVPIQAMERRGYVHVRNFLAALMGLNFNEADHGPSFLAQTMGQRAFVAAYGGGELLIPAWRLLRNMNLLTRWAPTPNRGKYAGAALWVPAPMARWFAANAPAEGDAFVDIRVSDQLKIDMRDWVLAPYRAFEALLTAGGGQRGWGKMPTIVAEPAIVGIIQYFIDLQGLLVYPVTPLSPGYGEERVVRMGSGLLGVLYYGLSCAFREGSLEETKLVITRNLVPTPYIIEDTIGMYPYVVDVITHVTLRVLLKVTWNSLRRTRQDQMEVVAAIVGLIIEGVTVDEPAISYVNDVVHDLITTCEVEGAPNADDIYDACTGLAVGGPPLWYLNALGNMPGRPRQAALFADGIVMPATEVVPFFGAWAPKYHYFTELLDSYAADPFAIELPRVSGGLTSFIKIPVPLQVPAAQAAGQLITPEFVAGEQVDDPSLLREMRGYRDYQDSSHYPRARFALRVLPKFEEKVSRTPPVLKLTSHRLPGERDYSFMPMVVSTRFYVSTEQDMNTVFWPTHQIPNWGATPKDPFKSLAPVWIAEDLLGFPVVVRYVDRADNVDGLYLHDPRTDPAPPAPPYTYRVYWGQKVATANLLGTFRVAALPPDALTQQRFDLHRGARVQGYPVEVVYMQLPIRIPRFEFEPMLLHPHSVKQ